MGAVPGVRAGRPESRIVPIFALIICLLCSTVAGGLALFSQEPLVDFVDGVRHAEGGLRFANERHLFNDRLIVECCPRLACSTILCVAARPITQDPIFALRQAFVLPLGAR